MLVKRSSILSPRALIVTTTSWPLPGHIAIALSKVGFEVAILSPGASPVRSIKIVEQHLNYSPWFPLTSIKRAIAAWSPDLLVCGDDWAVRHLHRIHDRASTSPKSIHLVDLIRTSLGDPAGFKTAATMTELVRMAQAEELRCPSTTVVCDNETLEKALKGAKYPILLKGDGYSGGGGVRLMISRNDVPSAAGEMQLPIRWSKTLRRLIGRCVYSWMLKRLITWPSRACVQEYITGRPANRAVVCWKGTVLAGITVEAIETINKFGATSVARIIDNCEMRNAADLLIKRLGMSGFVGFDFILDDCGHAFLLEMNPRITPISHLAIEGVDLASALYTQMTALRPTSNRPTITRETIALFPQEVGRSRKGDHLLSSYPDVPWDEPAFVAACVTSIGQDGLLPVRLTPA
jgi:hypothetical protein